MDIENEFLSHQHTQNLQFVLPSNEATAHTQNSTDGAPYVIDVNTPDLCSDVNTDSAEFDQSEQTSVSGESVEDSWYEHVPGISKYVQPPQRSINPSRPSDQNLKNDPLSLFQQIFSRDIVKYLKKETNRYWRQTKKTKWDEVYYKTMTIDSTYGFLGILLLIGQNGITS